VKGHRKPILANAWMVKEILKGKKTQTRRVVKGGRVTVDASPYGQVGDFL
jgi:hypothetical protein